MPYKLYVVYCIIDLIFIDKACLVHCAQELNSWAIQMLQDCFDTLEGKWTRKERWEI